MPDPMFPRPINPTFISLSFLDIPTVEDVTSTPSFSLNRMPRLIPISEALQKRHNLVFLLIGQPKIADRRVHFLWDLRCGPARQLFSRGSMGTMGELIARIVEMDDCLQALQVAIVQRNPANDAGSIS